MKFSYPPYFHHDSEPAIWQNPWEFRKTIQIIKGLKAKSVLEIGTGHGMFAEYLRRVQNIMVWSIDSNPMILSYDPDQLYNISSMTLGARNWATYHGPYDVVFIDGGHDYDTCHHDWRTYKKLATKAVMIHDIGANQAGKYPVEYGPGELWYKTIKPTCRTLEIHDRSPFNCGVGIVLL